MRFVASVEDGALDHSIQAYFRLEEISALRNLIDRWGRIVLGPDLARPAKDLATHNEGGELLDNQTKRGIAIQQIILVIPVAVALVIAVVLIEQDLLPIRQDLFRSGTTVVKNAIPCLFIAYKV